MDVLIYATGFEVQVTGIYNADIRGENGVGTGTEKYAEGMRTVFGIHSSKVTLTCSSWVGNHQASFQFNLDWFMLRYPGRLHQPNASNMSAESAATPRSTAKPETEQWWVDEVIRHQGKTNRNRECLRRAITISKANRTGRQDGNYNGGFQHAATHLAAVKQDIEKHFNFA